MTDGEFTNEGCPVEVYRLLPAAGEPEIIHAALPAGATVLDLGGGNGRIAHALLDLGHPVVAVDDSPHMLAQVRGAATVCARFEDLWLDRRFDAVLLASHLINTPDEAARQRCSCPPGATWRTPAGCSSSGIPRSGSRPRPTASTGGWVKSKSACTTSSTTAIC